MTATKRCVCGNELKDMLAGSGDDLPAEDRAQPYWVHVNAAPRCTTPAPLDQVFPGKAYRDDLSSTVVDMHRGLNHAGNRFHELAEATRETVQAIEAMSRLIDRPRDIRRATLNQVWDKLVEQGHMAAAQVVRDMVKAHDTGDWS